MFRLDNILEEWATHYQPLSHDPARDSKHRSFFRTSMIDANSEFVRNFAMMPPVLLAYATHPDAEIAAQNPKAVSYRHVVYFLVKQAAGTLSKTAATDELSATEARFQADDYTQDLVAMLSALRSMANGKQLPADVQSQLSPDVLEWMQLVVANPDYREGLRGLQIDSAHWGTLPVMLNGWHVCGLTVEQLTSRRLCIVPARYSPPLEEG